MHLVQNDVREGEDAQVGRGLPLQPGPLGLVHPGGQPAEHPAGGAVEHARAGRVLRVLAHGIPHEPPHLTAHEGGHTLRQGLGRHPPGLGDDDAGVRAVTQDDEGHAGGLAAARFPLDANDLIVPHVLRQLAAVLPGRQARHGLGHVFLGASDARGRAPREGAAESGEPVAALAGGFGGLAALRAPGEVGRPPQRRRAAAGRLLRGPGRRACQSDAVQDGLHLGHGRAPARRGQGKQQPYGV